MAGGQDTRRARIGRAVPGFVAMRVEGNSVPRDAVRDRLLFNGLALALALAGLPLLLHRLTNSPVATSSRREPGPDRGPSVPRETDPASHSTPHDEEPSAIK